VKSFIISLQKIGTGIGTENDGQNCGQNKRKEICEC
jgi:hypothetical protein